jgi:hypothetical protein
MQFNLHFFLAAILCLIPPALTIHRLTRKRKEERELRKSPFKELRRRPAGETLRIKLAELDDQGLADFAGMVFFPLILVAELPFLHPTDPITTIILFVASVGSSIFFGRRLTRRRKLRSDYQLGFDGERFVGEELSRLIALKYEIYHDVPFDGFNIDHVLVGPGGVFIVETKARRKPVNEDGKEEYRVTFDGKLLHWPWGSDRFGIDQAKDNARTLSTWLSSAVGEGVWVTPILAFPGWMVERTVLSNDIHVLNPKQIKNTWASLPQILTASKIIQICHQLNQKCRISLED